MEEEKIKILEKKIKSLEKKIKILEEMICWFFLNKILSFGELDVKTFIFKSLETIKKEIFSNLSRKKIREFFLPLIKKTIEEGKRRKLRVKE